MLLAQTKFALDLLRENETQSSTIISPLSISIALDLALIGAKNYTANEIQRVLGGQVTTQEIHQYLSRLLLTDFDGVKFANKIYCADEPLESYKSELRNHYNQILFETINFQDTQKAADIINYFVLSNTDNEIKNLVNADSLKENVGMMLINVLKFEKMWDYPFTDHSPYSADFYSKHNATTKVDEKGTKAAAASAAIFYPCSCSVWPEVIEFRADHPFLFLIADEEKNIYFVGTFYNL